MVNGNTLIKNSDKHKYCKQVKFSVLYRPVHLPLPLTWAAKYASSSLLSRSSCSTATFLLAAASLAPTPRCPILDTKQK